MAIGVKVLERPIPETSYIRATLKGMANTMKHMLNPEKVTIQYPEEKWALSPRWRGTHRMLTTEDGKAFRRTIHETIKRVTDDIEGDFHFNTAVSAIMELVNALYAFESGARERVPAAERSVEVPSTVMSILNAGVPAGTSKK